MAMDVIDYEIRGAEMQFVEIELDPGEAAIGEAGSMMFMDAGIGIRVKKARCWVASRAAGCSAVSWAGTTSEAARTSADKAVRA